MFAEKLNRSAIRQYLLFSIAIGFFMAMYLTQFSLLGNEITRGKEGVSWIQPHEKTKKAYFRYRLPLPFSPRHAWISIASDDYTIYINGRKAPRNVYVNNASNAFDHFLASRAQNLNLNIIQQARTPVLMRSANAEWRHLHYFDIGKYLKKGVNVISVALQAPGSVKFYMNGMVYGDGVSKHIGVNGWKYALLPSSYEGRHWFDKDYNDLSWRRANVYYEPRAVLFASIDRDMLIKSFGPTVIVPSGSDDSYTLSLDLTKYIRHFKSDKSWLRIYSNWDFSLFMDNDLALTAGADGSLDLLDIGSYIKAGYSKIKVRLWRSKSGNNSKPVFAMDGYVTGNAVSSQKGWKIYKNGVASWSDANSGLVNTRNQTYNFNFAEYILYATDYASISVTRYLVSKTLYIASLVFIICLFMYRYVEMRGSAGVVDQRTVPYWFISLPALCAVLTVLMTVRLKESDAYLYMRDDQVLAYVAALAIMLVVAFSLSITVLKARAINLYLRFSNSKILQPTVILICILLVGIILRWHVIGFEDLQADENVSWDAARGILRTGLPEAVSGVFYTRSPIYHYLLALWLFVFGDTKDVARLFAAIPGVMVIAASYYLVKAMTKKPVIALIVAFLIALDPWQISMSRIVRFYQQMQFFSVLSFYYFLKGFIWKTGKRDQNLFFVMCALAVLSQEVFVIVFPGLCISYYIYYKPFGWLKDKNLPIGFITVLGITLVDMGIFTMVCLTPNVGVSTSSGSIMQLHLINLSGFFNTFFYGNDRSNILYTLFFFIGIFYWIRKGNKPVISMYIIVLTSVITASVLVMQITSRYLYGIYPFFIILSVLTLVSIVNDIANYLFADKSVHEQRKIWMVYVTCILMVAALLNQEIYKLSTGYTENRIFQHETALRYVQAHRQATDKIMSVHPMPAAIIFGGIDYYLEEKLNFDEMYLSDGGVIDRWAGGQLVTKLDRLRFILENNSRVWVILDESEAKNLSPEFLQFIDQSTVVKYEFFGGQVRLWDKMQGIMGHAPNKGGAYDSF